MFSQKGETNNYARSGNHTVRTDNEPFGTNAYGTLTRFVFLSAHTHTNKHTHTSRNFLQSRNTTIFYGLNVLTFLTSLISWFDTKFAIILFAF